MNKRGQAIVEFVIILPIMLLLIFAFIDFGRIIVCKNHLENVLGEAGTLVMNEDKLKTYLDSDKDYRITYEIKKDKYYLIKLQTKIELITPGLKSILKNPYTVSSERSIIYE